jgi:hypothetical protein
MTEDQVAAAEVAAQSGFDWETICRQVNPQYATWSSFERNLYRRAMQATVEQRRKAKP